MPEAKWVAVAEVYGDVEAEIIRGLLEATGIPVMLSKEGAGQAIGLQIGSMGEVQVLVPDNHVQSAQRIVDDYFAGKRDHDDEEEVPDQGSEEGA